MSIPWWKTEKGKAHYAAYYQDHKEEFAVRNADWMAAHKEERRIQDNLRSQRQDRKAYKAKYRAEHKQEAKATMLTWRQRHPAEIKAYKEAYEAKKHGISSKKDQLEKQKNKCPICRRQFSESVKPRAHHNHNTGHFEAYWCNSCNLVEGHLLGNGNPEKTATAFLKYFRESVLFHPNLEHRDSQEDVA
jgi:hypothetical protein